jgi:hypothetical protein
LLEVGAVIELHVASSAGILREEVGGCQLKWNGKFYDGNAEKY